MVSLIRFMRQLVGQADGFMMCIALLIAALAVSYTRVCGERQKPAHVVMSQGDAVPPAKKKLTWSYQMIGRKCLLLFSWVFGLQMLTGHLRMYVVPTLTMWMWMIDSLCCTIVQLTASCCACKLELFLWSVWRLFNIDLYNVVLSSWAAISGKRLPFTGCTGLLAILWFMHWLNIWN